MKFYRKIVVVLLVLLMAGWLKLPWEQHARREFTELGLLEPPLAVGVKDKIGQTFWVVSLGGFRTLVATWFHLKAFSSFENRDWVKLEDQFELIVALEPRTSYYWDVGAWHLSYNAAVDFREREEFPAVQREALHRAFVLKGRAFLERGIVNNPDQVTLLSSLGRFYGTPAKYPDYAKSAAAYERAWKTGRARNFEKRAWLYSLARVPGKERDAVALARELFAEEMHRVDTLRCLLFVLEWTQPQAPPTLELIHRSFRSEAEALKMLNTYQQNNAENFPTNGVDHAIALLKSRLPQGEQ